MSDVVKGIKITLDQVINSEAINADSGEYVVPKKATVLSYNSGTLVEVAEGGLYLVTIGNWFRSSYNNKGLPQVSDFNRLQDLGLTVIKDKIVRNEDKVPVKDTKIVEKIHGQEIRSQDNVSVKKVDKAVAPHIKSEKKN
jgi:hypothetical protein